MANNCVICGKYSGTYIFCKECNELKKNGKIEKCEECGIWHKIGEPCECKRPSKFLSFVKDLIFNKNDEEIEEAEEIDDDEMDDTICLICETPSNGYLFCKNCYRKYRKKTILLSITNCKKFDLLKESYTDTYSYTCGDGHIVKSKSEKAIDNYLFDHRIPHVYEKEIRIDSETIIHPDFYLPDLDVYIEHWGYGKENALYTKQKEWKLDFYRKNGFTLICTYEKSDGTNIESALEMKLRTFKKGQINFEE
ncbi:MAG: hypothetical protein J6R04_06335 [Clostridia bacterium]|nr:hypothetical protein [Clostridia bacterium]